MTFRETGQGYCAKCYVHRSEIILRTAQATPTMDYHVDSQLKLDSKLREHYRKLICNVCHTLRTANDIVTQQQKRIACNELNTLIELTYSCENRRQHLNFETGA
ncbi:hypothetical protein NTGM5_170043 [Candidatus Nitrotoga sp. M5]|nr:hypothetical protein NTGM5_170043 [Candidatus Nitrotoga sp. M5]